MNNAFLLCLVKTFIVTILASQVTMLTVFPMQPGSEKLEGWEKKAYSPHILERLIELRSKQTAEEIKTIKEKWNSLINEAYACMDQGPESEQAQKVFTTWMMLANEEYQDYGDVKTAKTLAYKNNQIPDSPFDQTLWNFLEQAALFMHKI